MLRNSTIIPKKKLLKCGHFDFNFSKGRCKSCANVASTKKRLDKHEENDNDLSLQYLVDDLDAIFSRYIRLKYADENGIAQCYTCQKKLPIAAIQNGHYVHRIDMATRFLEDNCRPQCSECNSRHNDDPTIFRDALENEKSGITSWLREQAREVVKPTRDELKQEINSYRYKVKLLEKKIKK